MGYTQIDRQGSERKEWVKCGEKRGRGELLAPEVGISLYRCREGREEEEGGVHLSDTVRRDRFGRIQNLQTLGREYLT